MQNGVYNGRNVLVTGAASGIGKHLVVHLVDQGATVICADINVSAGQALVQEINSRKKSPKSCTGFVEVDVTKWHSVEVMFRQAENVLKSISHSSKIDVVFANAGAAILGYPWCNTEPDMRAINVNLIGQAYTVQAAINHFRSHRFGGRIIVTASQAALHPFGGEPLYTASKAGVLGLVRATAIAVNKEKILINAIGPGSTPSSLMPKKVEDIMNSEGWYTPKETIMRAFDQLADPNAKLTGQFAEAVGETVSLYKFPVPTKDLAKL